MNMQPGKPLEPVVGIGRSRYVIDPSLFDRPVLEDTWKGAQGDARIIDPAAVYRALDGRIQIDLTYDQTTQVLATFRLQLKNRSLGSIRPPPDNYCPVTVV
ncbi:hypothetical protein FRZ61_18670 [Hypericibacter adhaerens]|uniref:Uncharacterized protein n=1 Tax=Hypericibacter adhaerens TaxID=2602016 RepID=A0A5J6MWE0_9PROT|nr:hypothetical protein FRZ61_18670 [Hypericibacter adhaerens]